MKVGFLSCGEIGKRIGISPILSSFIAGTLGVDPVIRERRGMYWSEEQYILILERLAEHAEKLKKEAENEHDV